MPELLPYAPAPPRPRGLLAWFAPDPPASVRLSDPATIEHGFFRGRVSVLTWATLGYALFYFVRKNLSVAMPVLGAELGIGKDGLGLFITLHGIIYGLSKFANGFLGDRVNARKFMAIGLILSALTNVVFGFTSIAVIMGVVWMLNGWFQGMGFPPCARLMTHWFPPKRLATMMSLWNTSHSIGAFTVLVLCGYLVEHTSWRMCFFVPAALAIACAIVMLLTLRIHRRRSACPMWKGRRKPPATRDRRTTSRTTCNPRRRFGRSCGRTSLATSTSGSSPPPT